MQALPRNLVVSIEEGPKKGQRLVIAPGEKKAFGRTTASDLACEDPYMSSKHFEIENRSNEIILRDLGSRNGTKLNDSTVSGELPIADRSQVQAGHTVFAIAWESREEDWQTQLSSASMRRSALLSGSGSALFPRTSSSGYMNGGSGIASSVEGKGNGSSFVHSPEERVARAFLEVFHIGNLTGASGTPRVFERLYIPIEIGRAHV